MKLPCGCEMERDGTVFIIKPCSLKCPYYLYAIEQSRKMKHPVIYIPLGEEKDSR